MTNVIVRTTEEIIATLRPKQGIQCEENILYLFDPNVVVSITEATSRQWLEQQSEAYLNEYIKPIMDAYEEEKERDIDAYVEEKQSTIFFDNTNFTGTTTAETINVSGDFSADNITTNTLTVLSSATIPAPTTDNNPATKKYVDDAVASSTAGYHPDLFAHEWDDKLRDNVSWLRGDTFSWQSGKVYQTAIKHLLKDILMDRFYITTTNGLGLKFYRTPENDTETQFAWSNVYSTLYTDNEFPEVEEDVYYHGESVDTVLTFGTSTSSYITTTDDEDKKFYRDSNLDETGYYAWTYNTSETYFTTSDSPVATDDAYKKEGGVFTVSSSVDTVALPPTAQTETIEGHTITYYVGADTHKIVLSDQESIVLNIYNACGIAWYYIVDTTNIRFKLPRTQYGFVGVRDTVGKYVPETLPNASGHFLLIAGASIQENSLTGVFSMPNKNNTASQTGGAYVSTGPVEFNLSGSSSVYQDDAPVQQRATQHYLYFYVGNFTQTALENTAGLNASLFNGKADIDLNNTPVVDYIVEQQLPSADNNYTWYDKYKSGKVVQGGYFTDTSSILSTVNFPIKMRDINYTITGLLDGINDTTAVYFQLTVYARDVDNMKIVHTIGSSRASRAFSWEVKGMSAN